MPKSAFSRIRARETTGARLGPRANIYFRQNLVNGRVLGNFFAHVLGNSRGTKALRNAHGRAYRNLPNLRELRIQQLRQRFGKPKFSRKWRSVA